MFRYGASPWSVIGAGAGGLAEGLYMGQDIATKRAANKRLENQSQLHNALLMLAQVGKSEDPAMQQWFAQIAQRTAPQLAGLPMPTPTSPADLLSKDMAAQMQAAERTMGRPLTDEEKQLLVLKKQPKEPKEMVPWQLPDGRTVQISSERAAALAQQEALRQLTIAARGGRGGGGDGGGKNLVPWQDKQGNFLGYAPKTTPPAQGAVPATAASFRPPQEKILPFTPMDILPLTTLMDKIESGSATDAEKAIWTNMGGSVKEVEEEVKPWFRKPRKVKKTKAVPPRGKTVAPPPGMEGGTDEEPPE